ncbi:glycosyltransferase family A protein [Butyrivibrio sp. INlla16]|uniref:glycosyltransferase family A protein n=1 Tax=Butyrivibrio sp. INlla16 TaxID=1520807 RepID=UPI000890A4A2|nr:glycosyltransferase family A protein [Butyrivibrio sp. INlla16]SDB60264.1 Glycosyltransferase like family 2 [Butyrivibrio sp. INlla16]
MKDNTCAYIFIPVYDDFSFLDRTIDSIFRQTVDISKIRVLIGKNNTGMEDYKKVLQYEIDHPATISVIHEKKPTTRGRILKHMLRHLRFTKVDYSVILEPGDVIYPDFLKKGMQVLSLRNFSGAVIFEADLWDGNQEYTVQPVYSSNCILDNLSRSEYYRRDGSHKIIVLYKNLFTDIEMKLPYFQVIADYYSEWFSLIVNREREITYFRNSMGCVYKKGVTDAASDLVKRTFLIKRNMYALETGVFSSEEASDVELAERDDAYHNLSNRALQLALYKLGNGEYKEVEDCLIYAEMIDPKVVCGDIYADISDMFKKKNRNKTKIEELAMALMVPSIAPPREARCF